MKSQHLPTHMHGREMHFQVTLVIKCLYKHAQWFECSGDQNQLGKKHLSALIKSQEKMKHAVSEIYALLLEQTCTFIQYRDLKLGLFATQRRNLEKLSSSKEAEKLSISLNLSVFITGQVDNNSFHSSRCFRLKVSRLRSPIHILNSSVALPCVSGSNTTEIDGVLLL